MGNRYYQRGTEFERWIMTQAQGKDAFGLRSAGSHGKFDVVLFEPEYKRIKFIQAKVYNAKKGEEVGLKVTEEEGCHKYKDLYIASFERWTKTVNGHRRDSARSRKKKTSVSRGG